MTKESFKERERRRREEEIVVEAGRVIQVHGLSALNMDTLAQLVGISKPTLYQHFKSKEELIARILLGGMEQIEQYLLSTADAPPLERLTNILRRLLEFRYASDSLLAGVALEAIFTTIHSHEEVITRRARIKNMIEAVIEQGKAVGDIEPTIPTRLVCSMIFGCIPLPQVAQMEFDLQTTIDHIVTLFVRAVGRAP